MATAVNAADAAQQQTESQYQASLQQAEQAQRQRAMVGDSGARAARSSPADQAAWAATQQFRATQATDQQATVATVWQEETTYNTASNQAQKVAARADQQAQFDLSQAAQAANRDLLNAKEQYGTFVVPVRQRPAAVCAGH